MMHQCWRQLIFVYTKCKKNCHIYDLVWRYVYETQYFLLMLLNFLLSVFGCCTVQNINHFVL